MKVTGSRLTASGVSLALHAGILLVVLLLGRSVAPFVPVPHRAPVILMAPPLGAPILVRHKAMPTIPTTSQKISIGVFDGAAKAAVTQPPQVDPGRIAMGLPDADPSPSSSGETVKIITGVLGGDNPLSTGLGSRDHDAGAGVAATGGGSGVELPRIVSSPRAAYTEEALRLRIRGNVVLRVLLSHSGKVLVLGVITPLGHGLDESAREAAEAMEFTPARKQGRPVDYITTLRIVFDLS